MPVPSKATAKTTAKTTAKITAKITDKTTTEDTTETIIEDIVTEKKEPENVIKTAPVKTTAKKSNKSSRIDDGSEKYSIEQKVSALSKSYASIEEPEFVPTGSVVMDALLGGGCPRGSFILWSSHSGIGKSTGSLYIARSFCVQGLRVLYLDFEGGVNKNQLEGIGLMPYLYNEKNNPTGKFYCYRVQSYTDAENFLDVLLKDVDLVIIDSITAVMPEKIKTQSVEAILPGLQARLMTNLLLKYKTESMKNKTSWIMINQMRTHIRFVGITTDEEAGGNALKFYSDYRIIMKEKSKGKLEKSEITPLGVKKVPYGSVNEIWCIKSRYSRPFIPLELGIVFGKGISNSYAYKDFLDFKGCILREGAWYTIDMGGTTGKVNGENNLIEWISENLDSVKKFIKDNGGYRLLMNEKEAVISTEDYSTYDDSYSETPFENLVVGDLDDVISE